MCSCEFKNWIFRVPYRTLKSKARNEGGISLFLFFVSTLPTFLLWLVPPCTSIDASQPLVERVFARASAAEAASPTLDEYRTALTRKYPAHTATINRLLEQYPYWFITLERDYGLTPILAMKNADETEFSILFRDPALFMDIYKHIPHKVGSEEKRASYALLLSNALSISQPNDAYERTLAQALEEDRKADRSRGPKGTSFQRFVNQYPQPQNYFQVLKKEPDRLAVFLELIQEMDYRTVERFISSPNAGAFLLTTGLEGRDLLEEHGEEVLFLSLFLSEADQKRLPELFRCYPDLGLIVEETGMEGFLIFLSTPKFFDRFLSQFYHNSRFGCLLACEYIRTASDHLGQDRFQSIAEGPDRDYLAGALGEIAKRQNEDGTPGYNCIISDPYVTEFLIEFRNRGKDALERFGNYRIAESIIRYWGPSKRQMEVALEAIEKYGPMGIQAVNHFRESNNFKAFSGEYGVKALMILHYKNDPSEQNLISSDKEDALSKYELDAETGAPIPVKTGAVEFVPGYDLVSTCYKTVKNGRFPTLQEIGWSALDAMGIGLSVGTIVGKNLLKNLAKTVGRHGGKALKSVKVSAKTLKESTQSLAQTAYNNIKKTLPKNMTTSNQAGQKKALKNYSDELFKTIGKATKGVGKNLSNDYWFIKLRAYQPNETIQSMWTKCGKWSKAAKIKLMKPAASLNRAFIALRSGATWQTRTINELGEELLPGALCYEGVSALEDRVDEQLRKRLKEKTK